MSTISDHRTFRRSGCKCWRQVVEMQSPWIYDGWSDIMGNSSRALHIHHSTCGAWYCFIHL